MLDNSEQQQLVLTFLAEADEFTEALESGLLQLEESGEDRALLDKIFRAAHSLKGSSMAVGLTAVGAFTHEVEALLLDIKEGRVPNGPKVTSVLLACTDHVRMMIDALKVNPARTDFASATFLQDIAALRGKTEAKANANAGFGFFDDEEPAAEAPKPVAVAAAPVPAPAASEASEKATKEMRGNGEPIKVSQEKIDRLVNNIGEMAILMTFMQEHLHGVRDAKLVTTMKQLMKIGKEVQDVSISLRMVPLKPVFQKMKRIVRDVSAALDKKVDLQLLGEDLEVDKSILDMVSDPLVHIIRNAVDHGIEGMEDRRKAGKDPLGKVTLEASHESGRLVFTISDDGAGINSARVKQKAARLGLIGPNDDISHQETLNLLFHPGFSTKDQVTDISGRGVGMDVVKTNIEAMSGEIFIDTEEGHGTRFKVTVPPTFSIIDGTVVVAGDQRYVIPLTEVLESVRVTKDSLQYSSTVGAVFLLRGEKYPAFFLEELLEVGGEAHKGNHQIALLMRSHQNIFAVLVDEIIGRQSVVIKNLGQELHEYKEFSGSTILGDGKPALIVELGTLVRRAAHKKCDKKDKASQSQERLSA